MAQRSLFLTDGAIDGGPFSQAQARFSREDLERYPEVRLPWKALAGAPHASDGVFRRHLSAYDASVVGSAIRIAPGRAICDGVTHESDTNVDLTPTVPAATSAGLVVLQKSWASRTVRLALVQSANTTLPALTQVDGVTWEVPLWGYEVTSGAVVTIKSDRRRWVRPADLEVLLRGFLEEGGYAYARLGSYVTGAAAPATGARVGAGFETAFSGSGGFTPANTTLRGGWQCATGTTNGSNCGLVGPRAVRLTQDWVASFTVVIPSVASQWVIAGFHTTAGAFADANGQVGFRVNGTGNIVAYADNAGTESVIDTLIAPSTTRRVLTLAVSGAGTRADFWVDGAPIGRITANLPAGDLVGQIGIQSTNTTAKSLYVGEALMFARA
jgi:hypothetical protein